MTEIRIEPKKPIWSWFIAGILILAVLIYFLGFRDNGKKTTTVADVAYNIDPSDHQFITDNHDAVADYVNFIESSKGNMSLDHTYTNKALTKLIMATKATADHVGYEVHSDLDKAQKYTDKITDDPNETTHADNIKKSGEIITKVLHHIQKDYYPELVNDAKALDDATAAIKIKAHTLDQKNEVKAFLNKASDLLSKMN